MRHKIMINGLFIHCVVIFTQGVLSQATNIGVSCLKTLCPTIVMLSVEIFHGLSKHHISTNLGQQKIKFWKSVCLI